MQAGSTPTDTVPSPPPTTPPRQATGVRRVVYVTLGVVFVGIAILGSILPVLPTTPWVLLAGYFFARSSERLNRWLRRSPYFGHLIRDWETHRGIRRPVKAFAVCLVILVIGYTVGFSRAPDWAKWCAGSLGLVGVCVILFVVPTIGRSVVEKKTGGDIPARHL